MGGESKMDLNEHREKCESETFLKMEFLNVYIGNLVGENAT